MMLLSRFWYAILAVALAASVGLIFVAIHQHNRLREADTHTILDHDREVVDWYLRLDARRRLDALALASIDDAVRADIVKASAQETITADVRAPLDKRLDELAQKYSTLIKDEGRGGKSPTQLLAVDVRGRVVGAVNFDRAGQVKAETFELGGFAVVDDALHGWLRDDTWVFDRDAMYRVVARPVVAAEGAGPVGAVVALRRVDESYAKLISDRTGAPLAFYIAGGHSDDSDEGSLKIAARAVPDKVDVSLDGVVLDSKLVAGDRSYTDLGTSALKTQGVLTLAFSRIIGSGWDQGAGFAVARKVTSIADPGALLASADESDKKAIPVPLIAGIALLALFVGIGATIVEHSSPTRRLAVEAKKLAKGEQDVLPLPKLSGQQRAIAQSVNDGIERMLAKGGGSRKAADLEQVLGPVPQAPQMSAFSFGFDPAVPQAPPPTSGPVAAPRSGGVDDAFANLPPAAASVKTAPASRPTPKAPFVPAPPPRIEDVPDDDEATMVARIPEELMRASATGELRAIENADEMLQWRGVFEEFVGMRGRLGESTAGLSFEKFQVQLRKNKEQLVKQYGCKRVKFSVYEKDGKAALKATPIKE